jgi:hypothetical protein
MIARPVVVAVVAWATTATIGRPRSGRSLA